MTKTKKKARRVPHSAAGVHSGMSAVLLLTLSLLGCNMQQIKGFPTTSTARSALMPSLRLGRRREASSSAIIRQLVNSPLADTARRHVPSISSSTTTPTSKTPRIYKYPISTGTTVFSSFTPITAATGTAARTTIGAIVALLTSSFVGIKIFDEHLLPSSGILGTLLTAAVFSNFLPMFVPSTHYVYDLCWNMFLPGSLALLLLAFRSPTNSDSPRSATSDDGKEFSVSKSIQIVALPFIISSIGSLIGCFTSYAVWTKWLGRSAGGDNSRWGLSLFDARVATACLSASFVGGSVNFFATARLIQEQALGNHHRAGNSINTLLGSLATSDLIVMACYFAFLTAALQSNYFRKLYSTRTTNEDCRERLGNTSTEVSTSNNTQSRGASGDMEKKSLNVNDDGSSKMPLVDKLRAGVLITTLALGIVRLANLVEDQIGSLVPGTACAVIAVVAPLINNYFKSRGESFLLEARINGQQQNQRSRGLWNDMQRMASPLSELMFHWLFASIGTSANIRQALQSGPACLGFSSLAISIHIFITFVGCKLVKSWKGILGSAFFSGKLIQLEDVLIASNAAIGGPATAATFCSQMKSPNDGPSRLRGWTMAATFWGVFGYAIGTMIGVAMYRLVGGILAS